MPERTRRRLVASLADPPAEAPVPTGTAVRHPTPDDQPALARLMLDAYAGTIDYDGETLAESETEIERLFAGEYGRFVAECSFLALDGDEPVSASLVTVFEGAPLIAYTFTTPRRQGQGLARALLLRSMTALRDRDETTVALFVTAGNTPAERLYASLGFTEA